MTSDIDDLRPEPPTNFADLAYRNEYLLRVLHSKRHFSTKARIENPLEGKPGHELLVAPMPEPGSRYDYTIDEVPEEVRDWRP
jgi:hypothetical protein